jgi:hypothetical protein
MVKSIYDDSSNIIDHSDHNLELLLGLLLPKINAPVIEVSNEKIDIRITHGATAERKITIRNIGRGVLSGKIEMARPEVGIEISVGSFSINSKNKDEVILTLIINQDKNMRAATYKNEIIITSNASKNRVIIPLRLIISEPLKERVYRFLDYSDELLLKHIKMAVICSSIFFLVAVVPFAFDNIATSVREAIVNKTFLTETSYTWVIGVIGIVSFMITAAFYVDMSENIKTSGRDIRKYIFVINPIIEIFGLLLFVLTFPLLSLSFLSLDILLDIRFIIAYIISTVVWFADPHYVWSASIVSAILAITVYIFSLLKHQLTRLTFWDTYVFMKHRSATLTVLLLHVLVYMVIFVLYVWHYTYPLMYSVSHDLASYFMETIKLNESIVNPDSAIFLLIIVSLLSMVFFVNVSVYIYLAKERNKYNNSLNIVRSAVKKTTLLSDTNKIYYIDYISGRINLADLEIGSRVVDPTWTWEFRTGENYTGCGEKKPLVWIVVAKNHYGEGSGITLLAEELIGLHAFDDSKRRIETGGLQGVLSSSNHWGDSGTLNASHGLRPWLNSTGIHSREGFYQKLSKSFKNNIITSTVPNANTKSNNYVTVDKIFIPSMTEMGNEINRDTYQIGSVYSYFKNKSIELRIACLDDKARSYWTRSPDSRYAYNVRCVDSDGGFAWELDANHTKIGVRPVLNINPKIRIAE